jgi:hypothetical protein
MKTIHSLGGWGELKTGQERRSGPTATRKRRSDDESGALLILALVFLTVISVLCASLSMWATNNLNNTGKFATALSIQSASNSVTQLAVQDVRYNFMDSTLNQSPPQPCWTPDASLAPVSQQQFGIEPVVNVAVWCSTQWNPLSANTRVVTFSACPEPAFASGTTVAAINQAATVCALNPFLQAVVEFDDFPNTISAANCSPQSNMTCGTTFTVLSWAFGAAVPAVTAVGTPSAVSTTTCSSGMEITITGTNLSEATSVNVILTPANNVIFPTGPIVTDSATALTACVSSPVQASTFYQVSVTTDSGTSAATIPYIL